MEIRIACVAETVLMASRLAARVGARLRRAVVEPFSLPGYLAADDPPSRVVLCPAGRSLKGDMRFLSRVARRLLWPAPPARLAEVIGGLRGEEMERGSARSRRRPAARFRAGAALLLEGMVDAARAEAALRHPATRDWIVEGPTRVRLGTRELAALEREGVRWSALEPLEVLAVCASPALARAAKSWRALLPPRTPVWIVDRGEETPRRRTGPSAARVGRRKRNRGEEAPRRRPGRARRGPGAAGTTARTRGPR